MARNPLIAIDSTAALPVQRRFCVFLLAAILVGAGGLASYSWAESAGPAAVVTMTDHPAKFVPDKVTIKVGEEVEWQNTGRTNHAVASRPPLPAGAESFDSGFMKPRAKFTHKFTVPGTYRYYCLPHANSGMVGEVIVTR